MWRAACVLVVAVGAAHTASAQAQPAQAAQAAQPGTASPAGASTPNGAPATPGSATPAPAKAAAPPLERPSWALEKWAVEPPAKEGGRVRIMTPLGRPISLAEGLEDVGQLQRLKDRASAAERLESGLAAYWVERGVVFGVAGLLAAGGVVAGGIGLVLVVVSRFGGLPPQALRPFTELPRVGPAMVLVGTAMLLVGVVGLLVGAAFTALLVARPPPPSDRVSDAMGAAVLWDKAEAEEVTNRHNLRPDVAAQSLPLPPPAAAPAPAPAESPTTP